MTVHIIYSHYLSPDGEKMTVGGIQTYIRQLTDVILKMGCQVAVYQNAEIPFVKEADGVTIYGIVCKEKEKRHKAYLEECMRHFAPQSDILIWASELLVTPVDPSVYTIVIQHGIYWDVPMNDPNVKGLRLLKHKYHRAQICAETLRKIQIPKKVVCVDYNFVNWYRAVSVKQEAELQVIPNFSELPERYVGKQDAADTIKIIFARRFWRYRGTRLFCKTIQRILREYPNIDVTIAGEGPDEAYLHQELDQWENVRFITYESKDSMDIHKDKHIAVVPTLGSEGTSLSLLEAMASQCAVICTDVGGMTNIVIDHYNGLMIHPDEENLYNALVELINDPQLRKALSEKAYETVQTGFSDDRWRQRWTKVLQESFEDLAQQSKEKVMEPGEKA